MHPNQSRLLIICLMLASILLAACSPQPVSSSAPAVTPSAQPSRTSNPGSPAAKTQLSQTMPTPTVASDPIQKVMRSYHTILMLERAADLILAVIVKINTGDLPVGDPAPRYPYTNAFPVAINDFNNTDPPPGALNQGWKTVSNVAVQYNVVYSALMQGKAISNNDFYNLKAFRQIMTNYQNMAEGYLARRGKGADFFSSEQQVVDEHFRQAYGSISIPDLKGQ